MNALGLLVLLLVVGLPVAFAIIIVVGLYVGNSPFPITMLAQRIFAGIDSFAILAIPLFILAGELMNASGITSRIINFANVLVGHTRAGLAQVNIWSSVIFAGLSGSAVADTSALGRVFVPAMEKEGYPRDYAAALTAASSVIGPLIPPSIPVIIYALIASNMSVPGMFLAGVVPGLLLALALTIYVRFFAPVPDTLRPRATGGERWQAIREGIVPLTMPVFIVGSIVSGIVTPTEAAAFAALYALLAGMFVLRTLRPADLPMVFVKAMRDSSIILLVVGVVAMANWLLTFARVPQTLTAFVIDSISSPWVYLLAVNGLLLVVGLLLEGMAAMLVLVPILHPIAVQMGIDPTHFAMVVILNLMIGLTTPPMGLCLFVADSIAGVGMARLARRILPMFIAEVIVLMIITYFPGLVLWLPRLFGF